MKMVVLKSGITYNEKDNTFNFDFNVDKKDDLVDLNPSLRQINIFDKVYFYGYEFKDHVSSNIRTEFIHQIKGLSQTKINDLDFQRFLIHPVIQLGHKGLSKFNTLIYPRSERSEINKLLVRYIRAYSRITSESVISIELIKQLPKNIKFDFDYFEEQNGDDERFPKWKKKAEKLINKINNSTEYFSLAKSVSSNMRRFIYNYLNFEDDKMQHAKDNIEGKNLLLVDDINTSGSTLIECIKAIYKVVEPKQIVILTVLGRELSELKKD